MPPPTRPSLSEPPNPLAPVAALVRQAGLDAELAALLWLLLEARTPVVAVGSPGEGRDEVIDACAGLLPAGSRLATVRPDDDFDWLPQAVELGWRRERGGLPGPPAAERIGAGDGVLVARGLGEEGGVAGARARIVVRALALGYGLIATMAGTGLDDAFNTLHDPMVGTDPDERSRLGVVLAVVRGPDGPAITAAHYVRPIALDTHGHLQRLPPAVLATRGATTDRWDHFAWGALADLAGRTGHQPVEFEREQARRAGLIAELAAPAG